MIAPSWYSEPFPAGGGVSAEGVRNQLGRPHLSLFEVLAREAIQNSWDARLPNSTVDFRMDGRTCSDKDHRAIAKLFAPGLPQSLPLGASLRDRPLHLLVVSDAGTSGLGGPTRADIELPGSRERDFVAFVRNIGEPRDKEQGAGTFGFGKSIFYLVSRARTAIIYTRCKAGADYESRLIGCALGASFRRKQGTVFRPFTGRHWWGVQRNGVHEPLIGARADDVAKILGFEPLRKHETGTAIAIIDPAFTEPLQDMQALAWSIIWHAWPKAISGQMKFSLTWNGEGIELPDPRRTPPIDAFVRAYEQLTSAEPIECYKPQKRLGRLALHRQLVRTRQPEYPTSFEPPISSPVHHVALIRAPHLVVKYFAGDSLAGQAAEYAGIFEANPEIDDVFAASEPPTHDDWVAKQLEGPRKTFVSTTFIRLSERLRDYVRPITWAAWGHEAVPLGAASALFANLVATSPSTGAGAAGTDAHTTPADRGDADNDNSHSSKTRRAERRTRGSIEEVGEPSYSTFVGQPALLFGFRVRHAAERSCVRATASVAIDDNMQAEAETPSGCSRPRVLGWLGPGGEIQSVEALPTDGRIGQLWNVVVAPEPDTVTTVSLRLEAAQD
jgi:hypothetical protein